MRIERKGSDSESCGPKTLYNTRLADALPTLKVARDAYDGTVIDESPQHPQRPLMRPCPNVYALGLIIPTAAEPDTDKNVFPAL